MKTNFWMLKELDKKYEPAVTGWISGEEFKLIETTLCLQQMKEMEVRNLRDFVVLYYSRFNKDNPKYYEYRDKMSAIIAVIDDRIRDFGAVI